MMHEESEMLGWTRQLAEKVSEFISHYSNTWRLQPYPDPQYFSAPDLASAVVYEPLKHSIYINPAANNEFWYDRSKARRGLINQFIHEHLHAYAGAELRPADYPGVTTEMQLQWGWKILPVDTESIAEIVTVKELENRSELPAKLLTLLKLDETYTTLLSQRLHPAFLALLPDQIRKSDPFPITVRKPVADMVQIIYKMEAALGEGFLMRSYFTASGNSILKRLDEYAGSEDFWKAFESGLWPKILAQFKLIETRPNR